MQENIPSNGHPYGTRQAVREKRKRNALEAKELKSVEEALSSSSMSFFGGGRSAAQLSKKKSQKSRKTVKTALPEATTSDNNAALLFSSSSSSSSSSFIAPVSSHEIKQAGVDVSTLSHDQVFDVRTPSPEVSAGAHHVEDKDVFKRLMFLVLMDPQNDDDYDKVLLEFRSLLPRLKNVNEQDRYGRTLVMQVAYVGSLAMAEALFEHFGEKVDLELRDGNQWSALRLAVWNSDTEMANFLHEHGAQLTDKPVPHYTAKEQFTLETESPRLKQLVANTNACSKQEYQSMQHWFTTVVTQSASSEEATSSTRSPLAAEASEASSSSLTSAP